MVSADLLINFALNGIVVGSILSLAAIGLTLVYGILNLSNFAHGDYLTLGAFAAFYFNVTVAAGGDFTTAVMAGTVIGVVLALAAAVDAFTTKRLETTERVVLASAGGVLLVLAAAQLWGAGVGLPRIFHTGILLPTLIAAVAVPAFAIGMDFAVWKPLRRKRATVLTFIIVSIGLALFLRHAIAMRFGATVKRYRYSAGPSIELGDFTLTRVKVATIVIAIVLIIVVHVLLKYTRVGKALRALSDNVELARVTGIDVDRMILYVWVIAGALAAVAGVLLALVTSVHPSLGWNLLLPIFAAVILGGIGSPYGAMLGGLVIGVAMEMSVAWNPNYRVAVAFAVLILVLLVRPQGILGGKV